MFNFIIYGKVVKSNQIHALKYKDTDESYILLYLYTTTLHFRQNGDTLHYI